MLSMLPLLGACELLDPTHEGYTLTKVNGKPLPATYESSPGVLEALIVKGHIDLLPPNRFRIYFEHRQIAYDGGRVLLDTTFIDRRAGTYSWTDSTFEYSNSPRQHDSYSILDGRKILFGFEDLPFNMTVEWARDR